MKNMDKGLTVPKWVLINRLKIPQMPQNLSAKIVCPSPKVWDFDEKRLHWASVVREPDKTQCGFIGFSWDVLGPIKKGVAFCIHNPNDTSQMP